MLIWPETFTSNDHTYSYLDVFRYFCILCFIDCCCNSDVCCTATFYLAVKVGCVRCTILNSRYDAGLTILQYRLDDSLNAGFTIPPMLAVLSMLALLFSPHTNAYTARPPRGFQWVASRPPQHKHMQHINLITVHTFSHTYTRPRQYTCIQTMIIIHVVIAYQLPVASSCLYSQHRPRCCEPCNWKRDVIKYVTFA
jgi:hypothetical protein